MAKLSRLFVLNLLVVCCAALFAGCSSEPSMSDDPNATDPGLNAAAGTEIDTLDTKDAKKK